MATIGAISKADVYKYFRGREFVEAGTIESFRQQLSPDDAVALSIALEPFVAAVCPSCSASGYFRFHFLGKLRHSECDCSWYMTTGQYTGRQFRRAFATGADIAGSGPRDSGVLSRMVSFVFGAWIRLAFGLATIPLQAIAAHSAKRSPGVESTVDAPKLTPTELWLKYRESLITQAVELAQEATKVGALVVQDDAQFKTAVNDRLWQLLPLPIRVIGRERLRFDSVLLGARQHLFVIDGDVVRLRPDAREQLQATLADVFGLKKGGGATATPDSPAAT